MLRSSLRAKRSNPCISECGSMDCFVASLLGVAAIYPKNVLWFEVLLYLSLTLDAVWARFGSPNANMTEQMINVGTVMAAGLILLLISFVWLAATP